MTHFAKAVGGEVGARSATAGEGDAGGSETKAKQSKAEKEEGGADKQYIRGPGLQHK